MAAYAALVSLMNLIEQIRDHPRPPITLDKEQTESLTEKIAFLQDFLEDYNYHDGNQEVECLRIRIADAAYATEDVIELRAVNRIRPRSISYEGEDIISLRDFFEHGLQSPIADAAEDVTESHVIDKSVAEPTTHGGENISSIDFYQGLQEMVGEMDSIKKDVMHMKDRTGIRDQLQRIFTAPVVSSKSPSTEHKTIVGFEDVLYEMLDKLTGQQSDRQIIPISGMGGIGKTTLAKIVYSNPLVEHRFDIRAWVTISQEYSVKEILLEVLLCLKHQEHEEILSQKSEQDLGLQLHKNLSGRRYLIIMDDMWSVEAWDKVKFFFPDNNNGSRIVITTRISKLARDLDGTVGLEMSFLDGDKSWDLLCKTVFGEQGCPEELEQIGKRIAKNCNGLPLCIVVTGGLLAKSQQTREYWEYIAKYLNPVVNLDDNERCLKILRSSYNQLPIHLKPCFLYMGIFPEDTDIHISTLIKQWIAEGFLKPSMTKTLEETAEEYLTGLIERNLILASPIEWSENPVTCKIHDLLRDLCIREAQKEKFLYVTSQNSLNIIPPGIRTIRRIAILESTSQKEYHPLDLHALESASLARSLICHFLGGLPSHGFRLLRVFKGVSSVKRSYSITDVFQLINSRFLDVTPYCDPSSSISSSIYVLWNLQTLICKKTSPNGIELPEFWMMPQLRHVEVSKLHLPNPHSGQIDKQDEFVMENLQTLEFVYDLKLSEEVVKRIPNVKKMKIHYEDLAGYAVASHYCLNNLRHLQKLEYLKCSFDFRKMERHRFKLDLRNDISLPISLKELYLSNCKLKWKDVNIKIGSLPFLQRLALVVCYSTGSKWETDEGQFTSLKCLTISRCLNLKRWTTESTHFPRLEYLNLLRLARLEEIPADIGEIPTLKGIKLHHCSDSAVNSAKSILEEQEENGNEGFGVRVTLLPRSELQELLPSRNFHVRHSPW